jgi:7-cyano-7-deazaguanine synthase
MDKAIVLLSGGMDSSTLLYYVAKKFGADNVSSLIFDYGRLKKQDEDFPKEVGAALSVTRKLHVRHKFIQIAGLPNCPLTSSARKIPDQSEGKQRATVVPGRNSILLAYGLSHGESLVKGEESSDRISVFYGACAEDKLSYPDCRPSYVEAMKRVFEESSEGRVTLEAPFAEMTKEDILTAGIQLGVPYELTYTCYRGGYPSCGLCDACVERIDAFVSLGVVDPMEYETGVIWDPDTKPWSQVIL